MVILILNHGLAGAETKGVDSRPVKGKTAKYRKKPPIIVENALNFLCAAQHFTQ